MPMNAGGFVGGVANKHMMPRAKLRTVQCAPTALTSTVSSSSATFSLLCVPEANVAIESIILKYTVAPTAAATDLKVGTRAAAEAFVTGQGTSSTAAAGDSFSLTKNNTSVRTGASPLTHNGRPVLTAGTELVWTVTGVANAGTVIVIVSYFPLDD